MYKIKMLLFSVILLLQQACIQKKEPPYILQEGEIITWKITEQLIIKAKLGERRKHIVNTHCPKCEREFYRPHLERYLGQFPIDYKPPKFPMLSEVEAKATPWTTIDMGGGLNLI